MKTHNNYPEKLVRTDVEEKENSLNLTISPPKVHYYSLGFAEAKAFLEKVGIPVERINKDRQNENH